MENLTQFQDAPFQILPFAFNLILTAAIAGVIARFYTVFGYGLSNRSQFAKNFVVISVTTMIIISVVKSSLALSLGLVGALSIVRFRAAIKEPEELSYLFLCIAVGLGMGANQIHLTVIGAAGVLLILAATRWRNKKAIEEKPNLFVEVTTSSGEHTLTKVSELLKTVTHDASLVRYEQDKNGIQMMFLATFEGVEKIEQFKTQLEEIGETNLTLYESKA